MKLLANENIPLASVKILRDKGYDIVAIGQEFAGYLNSEVMELAIKQGKTIITVDSDYGELIFRRGYKPEAGVIYIRRISHSPQEVGK